VRAGAGGAGTGAMAGISGAEAGMAGAGTFACESEVCDETELCVAHSGGGPPPRCVPFEADGSCQPGFEPSDPCPNEAEPGCLEMRELPPTACEPRPPGCEELDCSCIEAAKLCILSSCLTAQGTFVMCGSI